MADEEAQQPQPGDELDPNGDYLMKGRDVQHLFNLINKLSSLQGVSWGDVNPAQQALARTAQRPAPPPTLVKQPVKANGAKAE